MGDGKDGRKLDSRNDVLQYEPRRFVEMPGHWMGTDHATSASTLTQ